MFLKITKVIRRNEKFLQQTNYNFSPNSHLREYVVFFFYNRRHGTSKEKIYISIMKGMPHALICFRNEKWDSFPVKFFFFSFYRSFKFNGPSMTDD